MVPDWINRFETIADVAAQVAYMVSHHLPDDHFAMEPARFDAVTQTDVDWLAKHFLSPRWMTILVVGDRARIEKSLEGLSASARPSTCSTRPASQSVGPTPLTARHPSRRPEAFDAAEFAPTHT